MANTNTKQRSEATYEFQITQTDIVGMMNDPQVALEGGHVDSNQTLQLVLKKPNGSEIVLKDMQQSDILVFRYSKIVETSTTNNLGAIDVSGS